MFLISRLIFTCVLIMVFSMGTAWTYPENYLSGKLGASVSTQSKLGGKANPNDILSDGPISWKGFSFAGDEQQRTFTTDLGHERTFDRVQLGAGGIDQVAIEISTKGSDSPFEKVFEKAELGAFQILRLPLVKARWVRFDIGEGRGGGVNSVRIYKGYEHPKLEEVAKILHGLIKPDLPGLEKFYTAADAGDWTKACSELRAYYAERSKPENPPNPNVDLTRAIDMVNGKLDHAGIVRYEKVPIDWSYMKVGDWYEHKNFLNRGNRVGVIANTAYDTGDEKWIKEFRDVFYDWVDANPKPTVMSGADYPTWRTLDSSARIGWISSRFPQVTHTKGVEDELWANYLYSIWEHADYLRGDTFSGGNWLANVSSAVMGLALDYPEFKDQAVWLAYGKDAFEKNVMRDIYPDGKEMEDAPGYVCFAYNHMFGTMEALDKAGIPISAESRERMNKVQDYLGAVTQPDGNMPAIGDWGGGPAYPLPKTWPYFKSEDIHYILTQGKEGVMPSKASINFPYGGWSVMRSAYGVKPYRNARHLTFHTSQGAHGHRDSLAVTAYAYGRELLIDPGIRSYEARDREIYPSVPYHNCICVDGRNYNEKSGKTEKWISNSDTDYVLGSHANYSGLTVRRSVLFVKPDYWIVHDEITGEGSHTYDQNWHFAEDARISEDPATKVVRTGYRTGGNLMIVPADPAALKSESTSFFIAKQRMYAEGEVESKGWKYSKTGNAPQTFDTVLYPYSGSFAPKVSVKTLAVEGANPADVTALEVKIGDNKDYIFISRTGPRKMVCPAAAIAVNGEVVVIRYRAYKYAGKTVYYVGKEKSPDMGKIQKVDK